jgi:4-alpha-glucanotransferase
VQARWLAQEDLVSVLDVAEDERERGLRRREVLTLARERFLRDATETDRARYAAFRADRAGWLDDYALFAALHRVHEVAWTDWPEPLRTRDPHALDEARATHGDALEQEAFNQFLFFGQWARLHTAARARGIRILGDLPIFVSPDSADAWAHQDLFELDDLGRPTRVAGVPPDYFSETGQLWGNPLYRWDRMRELGFAWWVERLRHLLRMVDVVRIDHFRGFSATWAVPAGAQTAREGVWEPGPGADVFTAIAERLGGPLPIVAEDLGLITDDVRSLLHAVGFPGMKVLQFAFDDGADNPYLPHMYRDPNCVVYTGTHDNDTTRGWFHTAPEATRTHVRQYLNADGQDVVWDLMRLAYASIADTAIVPLQDVLDLGSEARMNVPGRSTGNWRWRVTAEELRPEVADRLADLTCTFARADSAAC